jgi:hypothetical protein
MRARISRYLRSNVLGLVAIFIALSGVGYAASQLPEDSIESEQIKNGEVKKRDLSAKAVTTRKVKDRGLRGADLADATIRGRQLDALELFTRTKIVDPAGDPGQNGHDLISAVQSINDSGPGSPYLVQLGPGTYDIGDGTLEIPSDVELAGEGPGATTITSDGDATVSPGPRDEFRDLEIDATGAASRAVAATSNVTVYDATLSAEGNGATGVFVGGNASIRVRDSRITVSSTGTQPAVAVDAGGSGTTTLDDDTITAKTELDSGAATAVNSRGDGSVALRGSTVQAIGPAVSSTFGLASSDNGSITADGSVISGSAASVNNNGGSSSTIRVGSSQLSGPVATPGFGTVACVFTYSSSYAPLSSACN